MANSAWILLVVLHFIQTGNLIFWIYLNVDLKNRFVKEKSIKTRLDEISQKRTSNALGFCSLKGFCTDVGYR